METEDVSLGRLYEETSVIHKSIVRDVGQAMAHIKAIVEQKPENEGIGCGGGALQLTGVRSVIPSSTVGSPEARTGQACMLRWRVSCQTDREWNPDHRKQNSSESNFRLLNNGRGILKLLERLPSLKRRQAIWAQSNRRKKLRKQTR
ncbi:3-isopropylmalate dehydrogenase [Striga asiatica]|uniref:3-isopropylmalate dehydrogenase n=1 Tax=Striga asiatica TaxID=4170 RepID=A0A5A7PHE4_STRAF|nr:3-isopropylmalate dehydrogenase [Striga asiatica]